MSRREINRLFAAIGDKVVIRHRVVFLVITLGLAILGYLGTNRLYMDSDRRRETARGL